MKLEINGFYAIRRKKRYNSTSFDQSRFVISSIKIDGARSTAFFLFKGNWKYYHRHASMVD